MCHGKDCSKNDQRLCALVDALAGQGEVVPVQCQKICKGPVVGLEVDGQIEWFSKLNDKKSRRQLTLFLVSGELKNRLKKRISLKRSRQFRGDCALAAK